MDYELSDSSGTDDDTPPSHQNRFQRGGRSAPVCSAPLPRIHGDMDTQIHHIEREAYCSVLRAFKAQSDAITWDKESLITELGKELRVSDEEHRELLPKVNNDGMIRRIREWRKASGLQPGMLTTAQPVHEPVPSSTVSASHKKQKTSHSVASLAPEVRVPSSAVHPSSSALRRGPPPGAKTNKPKAYPSTSLAGKVQTANRGLSGTFAANGSTEAATHNPLIGKKVWTRWPADNQFYEAVITDYNHIKGHALVYDINTENESQEWVNLKEIPPEDIRWENDDPTISRRGGNCNSELGRGIKKSKVCGGVVPGADRGRGTMNGQSKKDFTFPHNGTQKVFSDIEILHTDTLIKEVKKVFGATLPDPSEVDKAKKVLKEHEQALVDAIARLEEASDSESGNN